MSGLREVVQLDVDYAVERSGRLDVELRDVSVVPQAICDACGVPVCSRAAWIGEPDPFLIRSIKARQRRYSFNMAMLTSWEDIKNLPQQSYSEYVAWRADVAAKAGRPDYLEIEVGMRLSRTCRILLGRGWQNRFWIQLTDTSWLVRTPVVREMESARWSGFSSVELPLQNGEPSPFSLVWVHAWRTDLHWLDGVPFAEDERRCEQCRGIRPRYMIPARATIPADRPEPQVFTLTPWGHGSPYVTEEIASWLSAKGFPDCRVVACTRAEALQRVSADEVRFPDVPPPRFPWE